ncbi:MAG: hypothetical protein PWP23_1533 [Candidatus Sumerlaeota bacterium]|nr:hypothetical protein [Candidatus Sumerlaeota bacterium]
MIRKVILTATLAAAPFLAAAQFTVLDDCESGGYGIINGAIATGTAGTAGPSVSAGVGYNGTSGIDVAYDFTSAGAFDAVFFDRFFTPADVSNAGAIALLVDGDAAFASNYNFYLSIYESGGTGGDDEFRSTKFTVADLGTDGFKTVVFPLASFSDNNGGTGNDVFEGTIRSWRVVIEDPFASGASGTLVFDDFGMYNTLATGTGTASPGITIDGSAADWASVPYLVVDNTNPAPGTEFDFGEIKMCDDATNIYVLANNLNPAWSGSGNDWLTFDIDGNGATGYNFYGLNVNGSDFFVDGTGGSNRQDAGVFGDGFQGAATISSTTGAGPIEFAIPKSFISDAINNNSSDPDPLANSDGAHLWFGTAGGEVVPQDAPAFYTWSAGTVPVELDNFQID